MARLRRKRQQEVEEEETEEWSCPLCTLLNHWKDRRCAACDHVRQEKQDQAPSISLTTEDTNTTTTQTHVSERSTPRLPMGVFFFSSATKNGQTWRQEPRLQVNRKRRTFRQLAFTDGSHRTASLQQEEDGAIRTHDLAKAVSYPPESSHVDTKAADTAVQSVHADEDEEQDDYEPCFHLLGPQTSIIQEEPISSNETSIQFRSEQQEQEKVVLDRNVAVADLSIEEKLANAGLDLNDSDDDEGAMHSQHRQRNSKSPIIIEDPHTSTSGNSLTWECPVCTNFNSTRHPRCELCDTPKQDSGATRTSSEDDFGSLTTSTEARRGETRYIDLASSQEDQVDNVRPDFGARNEREFGNPYETNQPSLSYDDFAIEANGYDSVEDISDHEAPAPFNQPRTIRPELQEFKHFICVEDLSSDFGCKLDYRQMFGDPRSGKSYANRLATRRRQSQKRKRAAEENDGKNSTSTSSAAKKRAAPTARRASTGKTIKSKKRQKNSDSSGKVRRSSAPAYPSGINHYDTSAADLGTEFTAMAWEGLGSAAYH